ncbi:prepilin-type N-terminal cleavage/methylation domain-containing protein [Jannaschia sp. W003]|uniref:prepilin-type N-terminal cleavage/methylation domain-containing protein n=1 Tax=Jannaschia sp. W003 TaxID=2867012 RepID=UPI0021A2772A|nr:prepilin-type N-terminal cleavage/methylation domain-containing protein [Jannaschia sp. W003]UWQ23146.1 prepilin-type N-terminal cleavage/methylation domain-containing protein [Jannaschia sp. W003]
MSRRPDAGVTLVEVLVVLALVAVVAGAAGLGLSGGTGPDAAAREAQLLAVRLERAGDDALVTGRRAALVWERRGYRFESDGEDGWAPHPEPALAAFHETAPAVALRGEETAPDREAGRYVLARDMVPEGGRPLALLLEGGGARVALRHDGIAARVEAEP